MKEKNANEPVQEIENDRNQKLYLNRLEEQGLTSFKQPPQSATQEPKQQDIAYLAAILCSGGKGPSAFDGVSEAVSIWNFSGKALLIQKQVDIMRRGLMYFNEKDWENYGKYLISLYAESKGDLLRRSSTRPSSNDINTYRNAAQSASDAITATFKVNDLTKILFPGKGETMESRQIKLEQLNIFIIDNHYCPVISH